MFQNFLVPAHQRDFLRFFWWRNNDTEQPIVQHRSNVHLFGARSSPSVAEYGLKFIVDREASTGDVQEPVKQFIRHNFYVDDGLNSCNSEEDAVQTIEATKWILSKYHLELHKISSNSDHVRDYFSVQPTDVSREVAITTHDPSRALGVVWDTKTDRFVITASILDRPFTRRGVLSSVNGLFDPIGMISPVILWGRHFQRQVMTQISDEKLDWD